MASGGTITYDGVWKIHTFDTGNDGVGAFSVALGIKDAKVLVVGGGGGGSAGGGGAGRVKSYTGVAITAGDYDITVGAGGSGQNYGSSNGSSGGTSIALGYSAAGGYGGGKEDTSGSGGDDTRCGGGGGWSTSYRTYGGNYYAPDQPHPYVGGDNANYKTAYTFGSHPAGGGAGQGRSGYSATSDWNGGNGGYGVQNSITGSDVYYGGGGGGGTEWYGTGGSGGNGGGGTGGDAYGNGTAGTDGLGGGGGGGWHSEDGNDGGNGTVIIAYRSNEDTPQLNLGLNF